MFGKFVRRQLFQRRQIEFIDNALVQLELFVEQPRPARDQVVIEIVGRAGGVSRTLVR